MPSYRRSLTFRPIHSEKHETTWSNLGQNASTEQIIVLLQSVAGEPSTGNQVETGAVVRYVYIEMNLNGVDNSGAVQVFHWLVNKNPGNNIASLNPAVYDTKDKRWVLKRGMEMLPEIPLGSGGTVQTKRIFVVKIPKKMQRMGEGDQIDLHYISSSASSINFCGIAIYKEFK